MDGIRLEQDIGYLNRFGAAFLRPHVASTFFFRQVLDFPGDHRLQRQFALFGGELATGGPFTDLHCQFQALVDIRGDVLDHFVKRGHWVSALFESHNSFRRPVYGGWTNHPTNRSSIRRAARQRGPRWLFRRNRSSRPVRTCTTIAISASSPIPLGAGDRRCWATKPEKSSSARAGRTAPRTIRQTGLAR